MAPTKNTLKTMIDTKFTWLLLDAQGKRTRKEFALECGISYSTLARLYAGATPSMNTLQKISKCAQNHITFEDLVTEAYRLYLPTHTYKNRTLFTYFSSRLRTLIEESSFTYKKLADSLNFYSNMLLNDIETLSLWGFEIFQAPHRYFSESLIFDFIMQYEQPTLTDLYIISRIFDVSLDYLLGVTDIKTPFVQNVRYIPKDLTDSEIEKKFLENYKQLPQDGKHYLFALSEELIWHYQYLREQELLKK